MPNTCVRSPPSTANFCAICQAASYFRVVKSLVPHNLFGTTRNETGTVAVIARVVHLHAIAKRFNSEPHRAVTRSCRQNFVTNTSFFSAIASSLVHSDTGEVSMPDRAAYPASPANDAQHINTIIECGNQRCGCRMSPVSPAL